MSNKEPFESDKSLRKVLGEWQVRDVLPPHFQEQVWKRIENAERPSSTHWTLIWNLMAIKVARPAFAVAYMAVLISVGVFAGGEQGHSKAEHVKSDMQARYIQLVDPYQIPR